MQIFRLLKYKSTKVLSLTWVPAFSSDDLVILKKILSEGISRGPLNSRTSPTTSRCQYLLKLIIK